MSEYSSYDVSKLKRKSMPSDYSCFYKEVLACSDRFGRLEFDVVNEEDISANVVIDSTGTYINGISQIYDNVLKFISSNYIAFKSAFMKEVGKFDTNKEIINNIEVAELTDASGKYNKSVKFVIAGPNGRYEIYIAKNKDLNEGIYKINNKLVEFNEFSDFLRKNYIAYLTQKKSIFKTLKNIGTSAYGSNETNKRKSPASKYAVGDGPNVLFDVNSFLNDSGKKKKKREKNKPNSRAYRISKSILRRLNP